MTKKTPRERANEFLEQAHHFKLGELPTEMPHPETKNLSQLAKTNLPQALKILQGIEIKAVEQMYQQLPKLERLQQEVKETLEDGHRIFLCGCGATGRLSLTLETLWREECEKLPAQGLGKTKEAIISFMAGGDYALVRSIENFEDYPEFGAQQLMELGFQDGDLLISCTEGGETPFVIGATEKAAQVSKRKPYFLYCNPDEILRRLVERSRRILENKNIHKINLTVGPMAISGSTRLQATTVLMLATGAALFANLNSQSPESYLKEFQLALEETNFLKLEPLIVAEANIYQEGHYCLHATDDYSITVLTDSTERSPTFSLLPFENTLESLRFPAWTFLMVPKAKSSEEAWESVLKRKPRALDWVDYREKFGIKSLYGFDFSPKAEQYRKRLAPENQHETFILARKGDFIEMSLRGVEVKVKRPFHLLTEHLLLKAILNFCSTLVMGRLGRYENNLMLWVKSSNNKLIDRSIRYIRELLNNSGQPMSYEDVAYALFEVLDTIQPNEPAVLKTYQSLKKGK